MIKVRAMPGDEISNDVDKAKLTARMWNENVSLSFNSVSVIVCKDSDTKTVVNQYLELLRKGTK